MTRRPLVATLLCTAMFTVGCSDVGSSSLLTSGMSAGIRGTSTDGENTEITAVLRAGGTASTTYVKLEDDDVLTVQVGDLTQPLDEQSLGPLTSYRTTVAIADPEQPFTVSLDRTLDDGAPATTFSLPEPFQITTEPDQIDPSEAIQVAWEPSGTSEQLRLEVSGECIDGGIRDLTNDDGVTTVPSDYLDSVMEQPGASCPVEITISKIRGGTLDPAYGEGGQAQGVQSRSVSFTFSRE